MHRILAFDPGEHVGWVSRFESGDLFGGTITETDLQADVFSQVVDLIERVNPKVVVYEKFHLYPGKAKFLGWDEMFTSQVIGVIRYACLINHIPVVVFPPSIKPYAGDVEERWEKIEGQPTVTHHTKDALMHLQYYEMHRENPSE